MLGEYAEHYIVFIKMKKRILYIDLLSPQGHVNFNNIYIKAFSIIPDIALDVVCHEGYISKLELPSNVDITTYDLRTRELRSDQRFYKLQWRVLQARYLQFCEKLVESNKYDCIFISSYDEVTLAFSRLLNYNVIAICHANSKHTFQNKFFAYCQRIIANHVKLVVLNQGASSFLDSQGIKNTYIPHGIPMLPLPNSRTSRTIFVPIKIATGDSFIIQRLNSVEFINVLNKLNLRLIIREDSSLQKKVPNVKYVQKIIPENDYRLFFSEAACILLPYSKTSYEIRSSAMLMEAISFKKIVIVPNTSSFSSLCKGNDKGIYLYDNFEDIINIVRDLFSADTLPEPSFESILQENSVDNISKSLEILMDEKY